VAIACLLGALALTAANGSLASGRDRLGQINKQTADHERFASVLSLDLEGTPAPSDVRSVRRPLPERLRQLAKHPFFDLYLRAQRRYDVSWELVASVHYQETGFAKVKSQLAAARRIDAIAAQLARNRAETDLGRAAVRAVGKRYGPKPTGQLSTAMVIERARAWHLLGTIPLPGNGELLRPTIGTVGGCGYFGCPRPGHLHNGVDFLAPAGTPIHAADSGRIALLQTPGESGGYGNFICIQHRPHLSSCYAHLSVVEPGIAEGVHVRRGQVIGLVGSTGSSTAPHLHFEVRRGPAACQSCAVDPLPLLSGEVPQRTVAKMLGLAVLSASAPAQPVIARPSGPAAAAPTVAPTAPARSTAPVASAPGTATPGATAPVLVPGSATPKTTVTPKAPATAPHVSPTPSRPAATTAPPAATTGSSEPTGGASAPAGNGGASAPGASTPAAATAAPAG
jgi:murein DD-endopeptidase MepM/ murein hydrolase activator NlpD